MNRAFWVVPCATIACVLPALPAQGAVPEWTQEAIARLGMEGLAELPEKGLADCSREELAKVVAGAAGQMEEAAPVAEDYGRISRAIIMDEVQLKMAKEQEESAFEKYGRALRRAKESSERLTRYSAKSSDGKEAMRPLKELAETNHLDYQYAMRDYLQAKTRTLWRQEILASDRERQREILESIPVSARDVARLQQEFALASPAPAAGVPQQKTAGEEETKLLARCNSLAGKARRSQELLTRRSLQGLNRLEVMGVLQEKMEADQEAYQLASQDYAKAKARAAWLRASTGKAPEEEPLPKGTAEAAGPKESTDSIRDIMATGAQLRRDLQSRLSGSGYMDGSALAEYQQQDKADWDAARAGAEKALARYRETQGRAKESLGAMMRTSPKDPSLPLLWSRADTDQKEYQAAAREYALARMGMEWSGYAAGQGLPPGEKERFPETSAVMEESSRMRALYLANHYSPAYMDDEAAVEELFSSQPVKDVPGRKFKLEGEVRLDSGHSTGEEGIGSRTRLRVRLFPDYNLDNNWHARGMVEYERTLAGRKGSEDGKLRLDRYYLEGDIGAVHTRIGAFGTNMAEGNIYDSKIKGVHLEAGSPVRYTVEAGTINNDSRAYSAVASYPGDGYLAQGGYYYFDDIHGASRQIYMANFHKPLGAFDFGAMLLYGRDAKAGNGMGYVFSLAHGASENWRPGSFSYWLKYYHQPSATYVSHTMNGMADLMSCDAHPSRGGFRGIGIGGNYTINSNLYLAMEYYYLRDLATGVPSSTIWGALTGYFQNFRYDE